MTFARKLGSADLVRLKRDIVKFPPDMAKIKIAKELSDKWGMKPITLAKWITIAIGFPEDRLYLYDALGYDRAAELATMQTKMEVHRRYILEKAVEERLTVVEICRVKDHLRKGRAPTDAIEIVKGRMPEKPLMKEDVISFGKLVGNLTQYGKDWRVICELIKKMGKIQVVQDGRLKFDILTDIMSVKVSVDDMRRYIDEVLEGIPKELIEAFRAEYKDEGNTPPPIIDVDFLPAPIPSEKNP